MIAEDVLERGLAAAADGYEVPEGAQDRLREQLRPSEADDEAPVGTLMRLRAWRPSGQQWIAAGAAGIVVLVVLAFALGGGGGNGSSGGAATSAAPLRASGPVVSNGATVAGGSAAVGEPGSVGLPPDAGAPVPAPSAKAAAPTLSQFQSRESAGAGGAGLSETTSAGHAAATGQRPLPGVTDSARVVKTGELDLRVKKGQVSHTLDLLTGLATVEHGYVADTSTSEGGDTPSGQVTMRVPVGAFEQAVMKARGFGKVLALQTSGQDVTADYADLQARITALKATRATFLTILARATTIGETLVVQQHITDVQTQIDQLQGRLNVLADQSAMATLTVTVDQVAKPVPAVHHQSGFTKAVDRSVGRFVRGVEAIIGVIGPIVLVLLVLALGWLGARFGYRVLRRRLV